LIGQAPGLKEYRTGKPFQGDAGHGIRRLFVEMGIPRDRFEEMVYSTAVVKCFPGSRLRKHGREDERPPEEMVRNCVPYLERQVTLFRPQVIITLGRFPLVEYLKLRGRNRQSVRLDDFVGTAEKWDSTVVIFLPHTSGTSRWLNKPENRQLLEKAKLLLRSSLLERNLVS
jgi:uracil-DNA glycosylase